MASQGVSSLQSFLWGHQPSSLLPSDKGHWAVPLPSFLPQGSLLLPKLVIHSLCCALSLPDLALSLASTCSPTEAFGTVEALAWGGVREEHPCRLAPGQTVLLQKARHHPRAPHPQEPLLKGLDTLPLPWMQEADTWPCLKQAWRPLF